MTTITFTVEGAPVTQGSMRSIGRGRMIHDHSTALKTWRTQVTIAARHAWAGRDPIDQPCTIYATVYLPRPSSHYGTGKNAGKVKASAPPMPHKRHDSDKLLRAINDAITQSGIWVDDSRATDMHIAKRYGEHPGANITITTEEP